MIRGRLAKPNLMNGMGFGIIYSIVERNRAHAAKIAIKSNLISV